MPCGGAACAWILGIWLGVQGDTAWWVYGTGALCAGVCGWLMSARPRAASVCLLVCVACSAGLRGTLAELSPPAHVRHQAPDDARGVVLLGRWCTDPEFRPVRGGRTVMSAGLRVEAQFDGETGWRPLTGLVAARVSDVRTSYYYGDRVVVSGQWQRPPRAQPPETFDAREYWRSQGVYATLRAADDSMTLVETECGTWLVSRMCALRRVIRQTFYRYLGSPRAGMLSALLLGDRSAVPLWARDALVRTGTAHVLAVSGLTVLPFTMTVQMLLAVCRVPRRVRFGCVIGCVAGFAVLTGWQPSIVRASGMTCVWLAGRMIDRDTGLLNTLALAAIVTLAWQPLWLLNIGWVLSFGAVASLALVVPCLRQDVQDARDGLRRLVATGDSGDGSLLLREPAWYRAVRWIGEGCLTSVAVWMGLLPILSGSFGVVTPVTIVANLVLVPMVGLILALGCTLALTGWSVALGVVFGATTDLTLAVFMRLAQCFERIPGGWWEVDGVSRGVVAGYYALLAAWVFVSSARLRIVVFLALLGVMGFVMGYFQSCRVSV